MDWDLAQTDVVFLGAGFSRAVTERAPLISDFFADFDEDRHWQLAKFLRDSFGDPKTCNVEAALHKLHQLTCAPLGGIDSFLDECRARHNAIRGEFDQYVLHRLRNLPIPEDSWAGLLLLECSAQTTVVTANYDTIGERLLSSRATVHQCGATDCHHCKMCAILRAECGCSTQSWTIDAANWKGSLLKIHGSIAWRMCTNISCSGATCLLPDEHCRPFKSEPCPCCGQRCSPALVPPSKLKTFEKLQQLQRMWTAAGTALRQAESVLFFGFSVPEADEHVVELIRRTMGKSDKLRRIAVVDVAPDGPASRLRRCLRKPGQVEIETYTVPADRSAPAWLG
jgi:hypothetical protein